MQNMQSLMAASSGWDGLPKREDCLRFESWAAYQSSIATVSAYDRLFTNHDNLTDAWGAFWAKAGKQLVQFETWDSFQKVDSIEQVAQTLVNAPVLGMNIINEPFPGNFYEDWLPSYAFAGNNWKDIYHGNIWKLSDLKSRLRARRTLRCCYRMWPTASDCNRPTIQWQNTSESLDSC